MGVGGRIHPLTLLRSTTLESEPGSLSQCPLWVPQVLEDIDFRREKSSYSEKPFLFPACRDPGGRHGGHAEQMEGPECCTTRMVHELLENLQQPICHLPPMALVSCGGWGGFLPAFRSAPSQVQNLARSVS